MSLGLNLKKWLTGHRPSMRDLLGLTSFGGVVMIALATAYISSTEGQDEIRATLLLEGEHLAKQLAKKSRLAILYESSDNVKDDVNGVLEFPDVIRVEILFPSGKTVMIAGVPVTGLPKGKPYWQGDDGGHVEGETQHAWQFVAPIMRQKDSSPFSMSADAQNDQPIGFVRIVQSKETFTRLSQRVFLYSMSFAGGLALLFLGVMRWLSLRITNPLTELSNAFHRAEQGERNVIAKPDGPYDIAAMANGFNSMMKVLADREADLIQHKATLEDRVQERSAELAERNRELMGINAQLATANQEMEAFGYTVSHDLRGPVKSFEGFLALLCNEYGRQLPANAMEYIQWMQKSTEQMNALIEGLLSLARTSRAETQMADINLSQLAQPIADALLASNPSRKANITIEPDLMAHADIYQMTSVLQNLIGNAWKFTGKLAITEIVFGAEQVDGETVYFVRDNGAGFDMEYAKNLFVPFQRMHSANQFPGLGIGLATVNRIIQRHGGRVWAEARKNEGAVFRFTLHAK